jgi:predicted NBD/HSP70 family sugar kinase
MLRGTNQEFGRPYNRRIVLETIRLKGPISRADIAREVSLSAQTVSNIIRELELAGFLASQREKPSRRGQPATMLEIDGRGGHALGLQLTPGSARALIVDLRGNQITHSACPLPADPDGIVEAVTTLMAGLRASATQARLLGLGVAMPGPFDVEPMSHAGSTTIEALRGVPLKDILAERTGLPVFVGIDSGAAALGERQFGTGRALTNFFYIFFSAGLGGATIAENTLIAGAWGNAGEIGHLPLVPDGEPCPCGNRGCLERYVSLDALRRRFVAAGIDPDAEDLASRSEAGHPVVEAWIEEAVPLLKRAVVAVENLLDPRTIVIGGSLPAPLLDRLIAAMEPLPASVSQRAGRSLPRLTRSTLGPDAALLGAAVLALNGVLSPRSGLLFEAEGPGGFSDPIMSAGPPVAAPLHPVP